MCGSPCECILYFCGIVIVVNRLMGGRLSERYKGSDVPKSHSPSGFVG